MSATETEYRYDGSSTVTNVIEYADDDDAATTPRAKQTKNYLYNNPVWAECWIYDTYDEFGRVTRKHHYRTNNEYTSYSYSYVSNGTRAYNQISKCTYAGWFNNNKYSLALISEYEYDKQGNISKEKVECSCTSPKADGKTNYTVTREYKYDSQNRLISGNGESYSYDASGRLSKINRASGSGDLTYDSRGRLSCIKFDGVGGSSNSYDYSYDNYGNRTIKRYCNNGGIIERYNWTRGRFLSSITGSDSSNVKASYVYNVDGLRYGKTANGVTTKYYYNGNTLMGEDRSDNKKLIYCYDQEGICGFIYYKYSSSSAYTYVKNAQGDIVFIVDDKGIPMVKYEYDAWGNVTYKTLDFGNSSSDADGEELAKINPFRYRGYYYDEESKLYYLTTRYYDPWIGQFISPDSFDYIDPQTIGGINLYAYCNNNPIMYVDPTGHIALSAILLSMLVGAIIGGITSTVEAVNAGLDTGKVFLAALGGVIMGAAVNGAFALGGAAVTGLTIAGKAVAVSGVALFGIATYGTAAAGILNYTFKSIAYETPMNINGVIMSGIEGAFEGAFSFGLGALAGLKGFLKFADKSSLNPYKNYEKLIRIIMFGLPSSLIRLGFKKAFRSWGIY